MARMEHFTRAGSLNFAEAGRRIRKSRERMLDSEALGDSARAWKVWAVCAELTASWSKNSDRVHVRTIANLAGLRADKVSPILRAFHDEGVFSWVKEDGKRSPGILSLPSLSPTEPKVKLKDVPEPEATPRWTCPKCGSHEVGYEAPWNTDEAVCRDCGHQGATADFETQA